MGDGQERPLLWLRRGTSDWSVYEKVFIEKEYQFAVTRTPKLIIDAGANVGMATAYFARLFPSAQIISLEPESGNFEIMRRNAESFPNVTPLKAALWKTRGKLTIRDVGLAEDGFMVDDQGDDGQVDSFTVTDLLQDFGNGATSIDLLKIDIEGSEKEVFETAEGWTALVDSIVVELHENMRPGSVRSYYENTQSFGREWTQGENICLTKGLLKHPDQG